MPRQTSMQMTEATDRQVERLQALGFGTFTDIVRIAIDRMYNQEVTMTTILYQYELDDSAMFGADAEISDIDTEASYARYADQIARALEIEYPNASITVQAGPHRIAIDGMTDADEIGVLEDIIHEEWGSFEWIVDKQDFNHTYLPDEASEFTQSDYDEIFQLADKHSARVWKHEDGCVMIASYEVMSDYCDRNEENPDDWTEIQ